MKHIILIFLFIFSVKSQAQECNKFGAWLWRIEQTGMTHQQVAERLKALNIKRIYLKVADGIPEFVKYDEIIDTAVVNTYHRMGLEVWGWSYNYLGRDAQQAEALYLAAKTGYDGYVLDVEHQFDGKVQEVENLFFAFNQARIRAQNEGYLKPEFKVYCTTWGNPERHRFAIDLIDKYVDAFLPQTYVEEWGEGYINNLSFWITEVEKEYRKLKATKPIHHIVSARTLKMDAEKINSFLQQAGPETSIWRIPGQGVPTSCWNTWEQVSWNYSYCDKYECKSLTDVDFSIFPNPIDNHVYVKLSHSIDSDYQMQIIDENGSQVHSQTISNLNTEYLINTEKLNSGVYFLHFYNNDGYQNYKILKP